jgi:hypothetical protein
MKSAGAERRALVDSLSRLRGRDERGLATTLPSLVLVLAGRAQPVGRSISVWNRRRRSEISAAPN